MGRINEIDPLSLFSSWYGVYVSQLAVMKGSRDPGQRRRCSKRIGIFEKVSIIDDDEDAWSGMLPVRERNDVTCTA